MRDKDLQAHFEAIRIRENEAREHNLSSGMTAALLNLQQFLNEEDMDASIDYLENEVDILTLAQHVHTFPDMLREKAGLLHDIYIELKTENTRDPLDISALIETYLNTEANDSAPAPEPY